MARCGCGTIVVNDTCACALGSSDAVAVTGSGSVGDPYVPSLVLDPDEGNTASVSAAGLFVPGVLNFTSAARSGVAPAAGVRVLGYETDTDLLWQWNGEEWTRTAPTGLLGYAERFTSYSNSDGSTATSVVKTDTLHIPDGYRLIEIVASWPLIENTDGVSIMGIRRLPPDESSSVLLARWTASGDSTTSVPGAGGQGGSYVTHEREGLAEGDHKYELVARPDPTGTTQIPADTDVPVRITVTEL